MGYTTEFEGRVRIDPPLNSHEVRYLTRFAGTRRMNRRNGPYYCGTGFAGQDHEPDIIDYSRPPAGQPGLWCQWTPAEDGGALEWNGAEKFYDPVEWMAYLIDTFLKPGAIVGREMAGRVPAANGGRWYAPEFAFFTCDHIVNGRILAEGEEFDDRWTLRVTDNFVERLEGHHRGS